jgi:LacI family transcriptional regulator
VTTRADVAAHAGVSPAVVSYVINDGPRPVSKETRARVLASIEALDYRPNVVASALRGGLTRSVGLLIPTTDNPFFGELADVIEREVFDSGNVLSIGITDMEPARERAQLRSLADRRVDGVLLASSQTLVNTQGIDLHGAPVVIIDRAGDDRASSVYVNNLPDAVYAVEHLQSWGHRLIGCVAGPWPIVVANERVDGWRRQQRKIGAPHGPELVVHAEFSGQGGAEAALALLGPEGRPFAVHGARPTALFVSSDVQAHGVLWACDRLGLRVPEDVSVVSFDGTQSARFSRPTLTTMRQPIRDIGATAVRLLLDRVADRERAPETVWFHSNLVLGGSVAAPGAD